MVRLTLLFLLSSLAASASTQKIGTDLYAYISENDASSNSTFLVSDKGILVVDTGLNAQEGRKLLDEIRKISQAPVRWVVNTHYHPDHRGGNSVVGPDAVVISTAFTRTQTGSAAAGYALNETVGTRGITLYVGGHEVRIYHPGPAHTMGDLIVYFPEQRAIAMGDLFLTNSCPAMDKGDLETWITTLNQILFMPVEHVVPGHFGLATTKELGHFRDYLAQLRKQVGRMYRNGESLEEVKKSAWATDFADMRQFPQYEATFADNAAAYYHQLELRNTPRRVVQ
jgi:cyclase